ncbi:MAG: 3-dehydroquinate synthase [Alloprevotella sp.]
MPISFLTNSLVDHLSHFVGLINPDRVFVLVDENTRRLCLPRLTEGHAQLAEAQVITIGATDSHKTLESLAHVWQSLSEGGATRHSLLINLGGGMVTDLGGFAAATFKRGIKFVNIPTTLLSMVDAAAGGKTGINFNGLKNEVGCFCESEDVIIDINFLLTLDRQNLRSGYAEMLKHALLESESMWAEHLRFDLDNLDYTELLNLVNQSVGTKQRIVSADPHEKGLRKALNLGHTVGHALESLALEKDRPVLHGYAVAWGLLCELYLSAKHMGFSTQQLHQTAVFVRQNYGSFDFTCKDYETLYGFMKHDKKNQGGEINFTLLGSIGDIKLDCHLTKEDVFESLDYLREGA